MCAWQAVREGEKEVAALVELRRQQECGIQLTWTYPDADREAGVRMKTGTETAQEGAAQDYLASFLPARLADSPAAVMTAVEALETRNKCLQVCECCPLALNLICVLSCVPGCLLWIRMQGCMSHGVWCPFSSPVPP